MLFQGVRISYIDERRCPESQREKERVREREREREGDIYYYDGRRRQEKRGRIEETHIYIEMRDVAEYKRYTSDW